MLFSQNKDEKKEAKAFSPLRFLFGLEIGRDISPIGEVFQMFARMLASILASNRLFPKDHPAFQNASYKLSLSEVIGTSYHRLSFTKEGLPQILLFAAVFGCLLFSALLIITFIFSLFVSPAHAQAASGSMFQPAANDYGLHWINYLFFGETIENPDGTLSNIATGCSFQRGLSAALAFFSRGVLVLAGFILLYHLTTMIVETAHTGKFMGRANQIWAPVRLVIAIGLLVPIATGGGSVGSSSCSITGYNTAQYLIIQIAKWGSGLASQAWATFLTAADTENSGTCEEGSPSCIKMPPEVRQLAKIMVANYACAELYNNYVGTEEGLSDFRYLVSAPTSLASEGVRVGFGTVYPSVPLLCGGYENPSKPSETTNEYASLYDTQRQIFADQLPAFKNFAASQASQAEQAVTLPAEEKEKIAKDFDQLAVTFQNKLQAAITSKIAAAESNAATARKDAINTIKDLGWIAAGSWFNTIARLETARQTSVYNGLPKPIASELFNTHDEKAGEGVVDARQRTRQAMKVFNGLMSLPSDATKKTAEMAAKYEMENFFTEINPLENFLKIVDYGGSAFGLWDKDGDLAIKFGKTRNPLAEIAAFGQKNVQLASWFLSTAFVSSVTAAGLEKGSEGIIGRIVGAASGGIFDVASGVATRTLTIVASGLTVLAGLFFAAGFFIGFVMPLIPFFRFFFGAVTWILSVFGAIVAAPLFALAHLTPYGDGLPGQAAQNGYSFLLHIMLRPILMIFGLIVGFLLFSATITFFNIFFLLAAKGTGNFVGATPVIAKLLYTFVYCGVAFSLCNTCFKTIGFFPQTAFSWMGKGAAPEEKGLGEPGATTAAATFVGGQIMRDMMPKAMGALPNTMRTAHSEKLAAEKEKTTGAIGSQRHRELMMSRGMEEKRDPKTGQVVKNEKTGQTEYIQPPEDILGDAGPKLQKPIHDPTTGKETGYFNKTSEPDFDTIADRATGRHVDDGGNLGGNEKKT